MNTKNLLKNSKAYYEDNDYYEIFSVAEDGENKVANYLKGICEDKIVLCWMWNRKIFKHIRRKF